MRLVLAGMLVASLPLAAPAQTLDRRPLKDDSFVPAPVPPDQHTTRMPPPGLVMPAPQPHYNPYTAAQQDNPDNAPPPGLVTTAPPPEYDPSTAAPPDNSVTAAPLPPPDESTDNTQEMVPNPLDNPDTTPPPGPARQGQPAVQSERGAWLQMGTATLQALDKVNARVTTLAVKVGDTGHFGSLDIAVRGCFVRPSDRPADATAFLVIRDHRADAPSFTGWMVRSAPYMSMMAHPIYDIRVAGCAS